MDTNQLIEKLRQAGLEPAVIDPLIARIQAEGLTSDVLRQLREVLTKEHVASTIALDLLEAADAASQRIERAVDDQLNTMFQKLEEEMDAGATPRSSSDAPVVGAFSTNAASVPEAPVVPASPPPSIESKATPTSSAPTATMGTDASDWLTLLKQLESEDAATPAASVASSRAAPETVQAPPPPPVPPAVAPASVISTPPTPTPPPVVPPAALSTAGAQPAPDGPAPATGGQPIPVQTSETT